MKNRKEIFATLFLSLLLIACWCIPEAVDYTFLQTQGYVPILDPGHGEPDGGAVAEDGTAENEINLDICLRAERLFELFYYHPVLTRRDNNGIWDAQANSIREKKISDMNNRVELVNSIPRGFLISVHQNSFPGNASGLQLYYGDEFSRKFGEIMRNCFLLGQKIPVRDSKSIAESLFLFKNSHCPSLLVECGFLTSAKDLALLKTPIYREWVALCIVCGFVNSQ